MAVAGRTRHAYNAVGASTCADSPATSQGTRVKARFHPVTQLIENGERAELQRALEALVVESADLERLEKLVDPFNIFEALGAVTQEIRHSDFLAFLLNPRQNHGLGDVFTRRFIQKALQVPGAPAGVSPIHLDIWDLDDIEVRREWQGIDILLLDHAHHFATIVENKIYAAEQKGQLCRYWTTVSEHYPDWRILGILLTLQARQPTDDRYVAVGYDTVLGLVASLAETRAASLGPDVRTLMLHYTQMLRRHFLEDTEIVTLARSIYQKHQKALDKIFEYRPDRQAQIRDIVDELITMTPGLIHDISSKSYIHFLPERWQESAALKSGSGWTSTGWLLMFEVANEPARLSLKVIIGPGPAEIRQRLFDMAVANQPPFKPSQSMLGRMWNTILQRTLLSSQALQEQEMETLAAQIRKSWEEFVRLALPAVEECLSKEQWLWESSPAASQST